MEEMNRRLYISSVEYLILTKGLVSINWHEIYLEYGKQNENDLPPWIEWRVQFKISEKVN